MWRECPNVASYILDQAAEYRPDLAKDAEGNYYLFWVTQRTEPHEPKFDEPGVRDQVLAAWKLVQARDFARKQAVSLAAESRKSAKPLKETVAGRPDLSVIENAEPFSWMTTNPLPYLASQMPPQLARSSRSFRPAPCGSDRSRRRRNAWRGVHADCVWS